MLVFFVLFTVVCLLLFAAGQLVPTRVLLGKTATRGKVAKVYGGGALLSFMAIGLIAPKEARQPPSNTVQKEVAPPEKPEENGLLKASSFQGLTVPGRMLEAKSTGFTDCKADYYGYKCIRTVPTILLGLKALSAELSMDGRDYFSDTYLTPLGPSGDVRELEPSQLAYGTISVTFSRPDYDLDCTSKHTQKTGSYEQPASCIINKNTIGHLDQALLDAGWVLSRSKGGYNNYVHPGELVQITTKHDTATIRRISSKEVAELVARDENRKGKETAAKSNAAAVLESMKQ